MHGTYSWSIFSLTGSFLFWTVEIQQTSYLTLDPSRVMNQRGTHLWCYCPLSDPIEKECDGTWVVMTGTLMGDFLLFLFLFVKKIKSQEVYQKNKKPKSHRCFIVHGFRIIAAFVMICFCYLHIQSWNLTARVLCFFYSIYISYYLINGG